jgi:hypothetical protein
VIYTTTGAPVIGLGLLAARDIVAFLRHSNGADNPCAGDIQHAYAFGASQSGRFLRQLLYLDLNDDEAERMVLDGVLVYIAGGKCGGDFNMRFGQPSASLPSDPFPFNEMCATDPVRGRSDGLLERLAVRHRVPKRPMTSARPVRNGPTAPRSKMLIETAPEMVLTSQPKARCSGTMITPGAARTPTPAMVAVNMTASTIQA